MQNVEYDVSLDNKALYIMKKIIEKLKKSLLFNLSLSSKELFHSNFLFWIAQNYPIEFGRLFTKYLREKPDDTCISNVFREKENIDLSFTYSNQQEILIENKVKSIPYLNQLEKYSEKHNSHKNYVLLSLSEPVFFEQKKEIEIGCAIWHYLSYDELKDMLTYLIDRISDNYHKMIILDYQNFIKGLIEINNFCQLDEKGKFDFHSIKKNKILALLIDIRLHDFYLKKKYELLAYNIYRRLKKLDKKLVGFSEQLNWESDVSEIFIGYGMTRSLGLVDLKYKILKNIALGIQIQGEHYRMVVEDNNSLIAHKIKESLDNGLWFNFTKSFPNHRIYPKREKGFNKYGNVFFYKSVKLGVEKTINEIINIIIKDVKQIETNLEEIKTKIRDY